MDSSLKEEHLKLIKKSLYRLNQLIDAIDKAKCAAIDCIESDIRRQDLTAKLLAIKGSYFPGR